MILLENISEVGKLLIIAAIAVESGQIFVFWKRISDEDNRSKQIKTELQSNFRLQSRPVILTIDFFRDVLYVWHTHFPDCRFSLVCGEEVELTQTKFLDNLF